MRPLQTCLVVALLSGFPAAAFPDGLIQQLPEDGAWVSFKLKGEAVRPDGMVAATFEGTQVIRSVGRTSVDGQPCRWIELETDATVRRSRGEVVEGREILKLLIPEKRLARAEDPRAHVRKAFKGESAEMMRELDLQGGDAGEIESMEEVFHAPLEDVSKLPPVAIKTGDRTWMCEGVKAETSRDGATFRTETRLHKEAPFGVVAYKYEQQRAGRKRKMEWTLLETGKDARSAVPGAQ